MFFQTSLFVFFLVFAVTPASSFSQKNHFIPRATALYGNNHSPRAIDSVSTHGTTHSATLGLLSFDLDDTLFPTSQVVNDANKKMIDHMRGIGYTEATVASFLDTTRQIRRSLDGPITYTGLRKRAIEAEMIRLGNPVADGKKATKELSVIAEECYEIWEQERHDAAERYLFTDAIDMLQAIRDKYPTACIAAITNGKGNPLKMQNTLSSYFDFCVSGEDDDVFPHRKPHAGIYEAALTRYRELHLPQRMDGNCSSQTSDDAESVKWDYVWCHVGDCLANDVGASADCGALAVWLDPLEEDDVVKKQESAAARVDVSKQPSWSTASEDELLKRSNKAKAAEHKVATRISALSELSDAVERLISKRLEGEITGQ